MSNGGGKAGDISRSKWVAGVDGCRAGWVVVLVPFQMSARRELKNLNIQLCADFGEILALHPTPAIVAIDIPIGLLDKSQAGGRACDQLARQELPGRTSSVFSPPIRCLLDATEYAQVRQRGVSIQAFGILPKIREVDALMTPALQRRVCEVHPELAFRSLTGAPMKHNKKTRSGREERIQALQSIKMFRTLKLNLDTVSAMYTRSQVGVDDFLDACALAWVAARIANAEATCLPVKPPTDQKGLRMEMWF